MLAGGDGILRGSQPSTLSDLASFYASKNIQFVALSIPYFANGRNTIQKASQEVLDIITDALGSSSGYLQNDYTLIGGSVGTTIISSMLDFDQKANGNGPRLITNVGRIVMFSGPWNNPTVPAGPIADTMAHYGVTSLTSLKPNLSFSTRWDMYLNHLVNAHGLRIVVGDKDYTFGYPPMHILTNEWMLELTSNSYDIYQLSSIVSILWNVGHDTIPYTDFNFIYD